MTPVLYELRGRDDRLRFSPFCWRARLALAHKGIEAELVPMLFTDKSPIDFCDSTTVPVLKDAHGVAMDSYDIFKHLDAHYPDSGDGLLIGDAHAEARLNFVKVYTEQVMAVGFFRLVALDLLAAIHPDDREYFRTSREARFGMSFEEFNNVEAARGILDSAFKPLRGLLANQPFMDGDAPAAADYLVFGFFIWAHIVSDTSPFGETEDAGDSLVQWRERMMDLHDGMARKAPRASEIPQS
ncbi:glutathione S-transferase N-terminal domain-containing protein [Cobetia amphilecti]|uniref:glutathione S-transferase N-terminal domain-containing protein n=1 Tax=Cobetia amphilecti TaxID=1055104 RepID=UPI00244BE268|nr:glutathione S-transferase N-terminal domain-containing protein [Cobetia litoralis]MDH2421117.1 glutathione S-transferase N-terminal domain-containing protein [Cobetia litoralis]